MWLNKTIKFITNINPIFFRSAMVLYMAVILLASSIPAQQLPSDFFINDKIVHFFEYGALGVLFSLAFKPQRPVILIVSSLFGMAFGGIDEYYQSFTPGRDSSAFDMVADTAGFTAFLLLTVFIISKKPNLR